jgi:hypothetical protein
MKMMFCKNRWLWGMKILAFLGSPEGCLMRVYAVNSETLQLKCIFIKRFKEIRQPVIMTAIPKKPLHW